MDGNLEIVAKILNKKNANPNIINKVSFLLFIIYLYKYKKLISFYNIIQFTGETTLYIACKFGHFEIVKLLVDKKANPNQFTKVIY